MGSIEWFLHYCMHSTTSGLLDSQDEPVTSVKYLNEAFVQLGVILTFEFDNSGNPTCSWICFFEFQGFYCQTSFIKRVSFGISCHHRLFVSVYAQPVLMEVPKHPALTNQMICALISCSPILVPCKNSNHSGHHLRIYSTRFLMPYQLIWKLYQLLVTKIK